MRQASSLFRGGKRGRRGDGAVWEGGWTCDNETGLFAVFSSSRFWTRDSETDLFAVLGGR